MTKRPSPSHSPPPPRELLGYLECWSERRATRTLWSSSSRNLVGALDQLQEYFLMQKCAMPTGYCVQTCSISADWA